MGSTVSEAKFAWWWSVCEAVRMAGGGGGDPGVPLGALAAHEARGEIRGEGRRKASVAGSEFGGGRARTEAGRSARTGRKSARNDAEVFSDDDEGTKFGGRGENPSSEAAAARTPWRQRPVARLVEAVREARRRRTPSARPGGARLPGSAAGDQTLDLLDDSAMRRHMLDQGGGGGDDEDDRRGYARGEGGRLVITEEREYAGKRKRDDDDDDGRSVGARSNVSRRTAKTQGTMRSGKTARTTKTMRTTRSGKTRAGRTVTARTCTARRRAPRRRAG